MSQYNQYDPDDYFKESRMSFGEHIEDLRTHLLRALKGFLLALIVAFFIGKPVLRFIAKPVEEQLLVFWQQYQGERQAEIRKKIEAGAFDDVPPIRTSLRLYAPELKKAVGLQEQEKQEDFDLIPHLNRLLRRLQMENLTNSKEIRDPAWVTVEAEIANPVAYADTLSELNTLVRPPRLSTLSVQEAFVVYFKVCLLTGFVLASPWVFYQIWSFVAAGLYPHEKKYVNYFMPFSLGLFLVGVVVCEIWVIPRAIQALLWFNDYLDFQPDLRLGEWLGFAIFMPLVFGLSFQTPLVMLFLHRIGIFTVDNYRSKRRLAWFIMAVVAAIITPSTDAFTLLFLWIPMSLLYELGIFLCIKIPGRPLLDFEVPESEEMIEV